MTTIPTEAERRRIVQDNRDKRDRLLHQLGWTEVSFDGCPRRLVGKRCLNDREYGDCWCLNQLNDHSSTYTSSEGNRFILWEPYDAEGDDLVDVIAAAKQDGLTVLITTSVWYPPYTVGIRFDKATKEGHPA